jgi:hypothetical protein
MQTDWRRRCRRLPVSVPVLLTIIALFSGCVATERVYLTQVESAGPVALPPVMPTMEWTRPGEIALVPHFSVNAERKITGRVNPVGTTPQWGGSDNLSWEIPRSEGGIDMQVAVSPSVALLAGGVVGGVNGTSYSNFRAGLGVYTAQEKVAIRLDGGVQLVSIRSRVRTTVETTISSIFGESRYRSNYDDTRDERSLAPYASVTINSHSETSPINALLSFGVSGQPLFDLTPSQPDTVLGEGDRAPTIERIRESVALYSLTPALIVRLGERHHLLVGARVIGNLSIDRSSPDVYWRPFIQAVFSF